MTEATLSAGLYRWRVRTGTLIALAFLALATPLPGTLAWGSGLAAAGLLLRAWAAGHLRKDRELAVSGPYRYTRNPLYLGNIILGAGAAVASGSWAASTVLALYFALFYPVIIARETRKLAELFPERYSAYQALVPSFLPSLRGADAGLAEPFRWEIFRRNREWRAFAGVAVLWALLAARMLLRRG